MSLSLSLLSLSVSVSFYYTLILSLLSYSHSLSTLSLSTLILSLLSLLLFSLYCVTVSDSVFVSCSVSTPEDVEEVTVVGATDDTFSADVITRTLLSLDESSVVHPLLPLL